MPKCEVDSVLQDQVHRFMSDNGLTVNAAATVLGVNRTTFWRFCQTGAALAHTRARLRGALANRNKRTPTHVADGALDADASEHQARPLPQEVLADRELKQIRKACEGVLALLNVYEAQQSLTRKI